MDFLSKIKIFILKPRVVVLAAKQPKLAKELLWHILEVDPKAAKEVKIYDVKDFKKEEIEFLLKHSSFPVMAVDDADSAAIEDLLLSLPSEGIFVLNMKEEKLREIKKGLAVKSFTFGFRESADLSAGDININGGINFKISHKGNVVPFWLDRSFHGQSMDSVLLAAAVGTVLGFNLVEMSQCLKEANAK